jgi:hypothetical protein
MTCARAILLRPRRCFWASTPTKAIESSGIWRKRVGVEMGLAAVLWLRLLPVAPIRCFDSTWQEAQPPDSTPSLSPAPNKSEHGQILSFEVARNSVLKCSLRMGRLSCLAVVTITIGLFPSTDIGQQQSNCTEPLAELKEPRTTDLAENRIIGLILPRVFLLSVHPHERDGW